MAWDEGKFNAALANKLKNQDIHAQVEGFNATSNRMNAATQADLLPSQQAMHLAQAQAGLMDANTKRGVLGAGMEGRLFTPTQVNSLGMGGAGGFRGLTTSQQIGLRSPAAPSLLAAPNQNPLLAPPTTPAPGGLQQAQAGIQPSMSSNLATTPAGAWNNMTDKYKGYGGFARGGPIGDVRQDRGKDTKKALVRPGEYLLNKEAVEGAFGDGDYDEGVRNLDEIVRRATGNEPGPTYSKKGEAGFALSGAEPAIPNRGIRHFSRFAPPVPVEGPVAPDNPLLPQSQRMRGYALPAAVPVVPALDPMSQRNRPHLAAAAAAAAGQPAASGASLRMKNLYGLPAGGVSDFATNMVAPAAPTPTLQQIGREAVAQHGMIEPSPTPYGAEWATRDKIRGGAAAPNPTGGNMYIPQGGAGNLPGEQMAINYGAGHGMGEGATPIIATADASGRFNQFGDPGTANRRPTLRMARGGQVPHFARSGKAPFTIIGDYQDPFLDARADNAPFTNIGGRTDPFAGQRTQGAPFTNLGGQGDPLAGMRTPGAPYSYVGGPQDPFAGQRGSGAFTNIGGQGDPYAKYRTDDGLSSAGKWKKFATQDVGATAKKSVQAVKEALPEAATINKWGLRGAKYLGAPAAAVLAGTDIADVATDPAMTKGDVANEVASKGSRWLAGAAGAAAAAPYGAPLGPLGTSLAALAGGAAGYFGMEGLTKGGRALFGGETSDPSERSHGAVSKWLEKPNEPALKPREGDAFDWQNAPTPAQAGPVGPAAPPKPSLRDMLIQQYMDAEHPTNEASGTIGAWAKQKHILDFLKHGEGGGSGNTDALNAAKMMEVHEKEIDESLRPRFKTTVKDDKGNVKETDDLAAYERFKADAAAHGQNVYQMSRAKRDALLAEWTERDRVGQKAKAIQSKSGDTSQLVSDRTRPVGLKAGLDFSDYWGSPNIGLGDYAKSFFGKGLRNQTAMIPVKDPVTGRVVQQAFPASKLYENDDGTIDLDAYSHAQRFKGR